jgi:hypothetical protein
MADSDVRSPIIVVDLVKEPKIRFEFRVTAKPDKLTTIQHGCDSREGLATHRELNDQTYDEILEAVRQVLDEVKASIAQR